MVWLKDQNLVNGQRRNIQLTLAFPEEERGETSRASGEGTEPLTATTKPRDLVRLTSLMEEIPDQQNLNRAYSRILSHRGARTPGVDGMTVRQLRVYVQKHWPQIEAQLRAGTYRPLPVKRVSRFPNREVEWVAILRPKPPAVRTACGASAAARP